LSPPPRRSSPGALKIKGIGAGFIPEILNTKIIDEVIPVSNGAAFETARDVAKREGILRGISSGAAVFGALAVAHRSEYRANSSWRSCPAPANATLAPSSSPPTEPEIGSPVFPAWAFPLARHYRAVMAWAP